MDINALGFPSWLELYQYIEREDLLGHEKITLVWNVREQQSDTPDPLYRAYLDRIVGTEGHEVVINLETVRANAFRELYAALPSRVAVEVLREMVKSLTQLAGKKHTQPLLEFLTKIPTRP